MNEKDAQPAAESSAPEVLSSAQPPHPNGGEAPAADPKGSSESVTSAHAPLAPEAGSPPKAESVKAPAKVIIRRGIAVEDPNKATLERAVPEPPKAKAEKK